MKYGFIALYSTRNRYEPTGYVRRTNRVRSEIHRTRIAYEALAVSPISETETQRIWKKLRPGKILPMNRTQSHLTSEERIYQKLVDSPLYQTYRQAFINATGMSLVLLPADGDILAADQGERFRNSFCAKLNAGKNDACKACNLAHRCLSDSVGERPETITCFAKMRETAIPIRAGNQTIALLTTGQVFTESPTEQVFEAIREKLIDSGSTEAEIKELFETWSEGRVVSLDQYEGTITILAAFALQLSDLLNRLLIENSNSEPDVVIRAKRFINANLDDKICLEEVANHVGVSSFYFCKVFRQSTGMTLTEYVNRRRVEWAKHKLLNPQARVTEVAFDVGYQSLSQFNRSFLKYVGVSPTKFREKQSTKAKSVEKVAA